MSTRRVRLLSDAGVAGAVALILVVTLDSNVPNNQAFVAVDGSYYTLGLIPLAAHFTLFGRSASQWRCASSPIDPA